MRITQLHLAGHEGGRALSVDRLQPQLNVVFGPPLSGKSTIAQLAAHLMYGKAEGPARPEPLGNAHLVEGSIEVDAPQGRFLLRRHRDGTATGRLSIAAVNGAAVDGRTVRELLYDLAPSLLAELYVVDFARAPRAAALLAPDFARLYAAALHADSTKPAADGGGPPRVDRAPATSAGIDQLVRRRDETARAIELQLSARRRESAELERQSHELEAKLGALRGQAEERLTRLRAVEIELAAVESRLRYLALASDGHRNPLTEPAKHRQQLEELDATISRTRQTLAELQSREAAVRRDLAEVHPDGTADSASILADQRAAVGVFECLLDELDAEVAQLARSHEPGRDVGRDYSLRLLPVAQMLRHQLYAFCGQVTEQERAVRRVQLHAESRQLARAQADFREQLEHLLERRQSLVHEEQLAQRTTAPAPQAPAANHCRCHGHEQFVRDAAAMLLAGGNRRSLEETMQVERAALERKRDQVRQECDALRADIDELDAQWRSLQRQRGQAVSGSDVDELRAELARLEDQINRVVSGEPSVPAAMPILPHRRLWKASDALAQLSGGRLLEIRRGGGSRQAQIIDRDGRSLAIDQLSGAQQDQLYLALTLALTSSLSSRGVDLPLLLDEPFLRQDARSALAMAGVLHEFASHGRQVIVFTADREAARRCQSLGTPVHDLCFVNQPAPPKREPPVVAAPASPSLGGATLRLVRETVGESPQPRVAGEWTRGADEPEVYFLDEDASIADFPVLGNDTASVFRGLGINTVHELLIADAADVAATLNRHGITSETVRLWQVHMSLMCFVPGLTLNDAQVLAACEIDSPEALYTVDGRLLAESVERFLEGSGGRRFAALRDRFTPERLAELQRSALRQRERWLQARVRRRWTDDAKKVAVQRTISAPAPAVKLSAAGRPRGRRPLRYLLGRNSSVEEAPSIGPAAAERLGRVGIRTVADLLQANPDSTAEEIGEPRVTPETVLRWQREARLACCIPELRSCGARLLVAAGFTEPSQLAAAPPAEVVRRVRNLCRLPEGRRLLRSGKAPSAERIALWAKNAAHMRPLEAA